MSSSLSAYITIYILSYYQEENLEASYLEYFIPIFAVILTLTGVYASSINAKQAYMKQRSDSVKPDISLKNVKWKQGEDLDYKRTLNVETQPTMGRGAGYRQTIVYSKLAISNFGLNTARNVIFIINSEDGFLIRHGQSQYKALKKNEEDCVYIGIPDIKHDKPFTIYSLCENVYGEPVLHAHMFFGKSNGENVYHCGDRFINKESREYKRLKRKLFI